MISMFASGNIDARYIITICFIIIAVGCLFGGAIISGDSQAETIIGLSVMGFASAGLFIPAIPEALNSMVHFTIVKSGRIIDRGESYANV